VARGGTDAAKLRIAAAFAVHRKVLLLGISPAEASVIVRETHGSTRLFSDKADGPFDLILVNEDVVPDGVVELLVPDGILLAFKRGLAQSSFSTVFQVGGVQIATNAARWGEILPAWINIDNQPYAGIDFLWDLSAGIPFRDTKLIFAEHFIEHLSYDSASRFARECRQALGEDGVLRMSTPNLDWVWSIAYRPHAWETSEQAQKDCFITNRAFRAWGHQFLYNAQTLEALLHNAGFDQVTFHQYGESDHPSLRGLERHPRDPDQPSMPHVIIAEARGTRAVTSIEGEQMIADYHRDLSAI
jgi:predicted SAM-dependent methyltransferase